MTSADRTNGRANATVQCCVCLSFVCLSVALCIVAKRCALEQKLLLTAYRKSYMRNRLVPKWMTLTFTQRSFIGGPMEPSPSLTVSEIFNGGCDVAVATNHYVTFAVEYLGDH